MYVYMCVFVRERARYDNFDPYFADVFRHNFTISNKWLWAQQNNIEHYNMFYRCVKIFLTL